VKDLATKIASNKVLLGAAAITTSVMAGVIAHLLQPEAEQDTAVPALTLKFNTANLPENVELDSTAIDQIDVLENVELIVLPTETEGQPLADASGAVPPSLFSRPYSDQPEASSLVNEDEGQAPGSEFDVCHP